MKTRILLSLLAFSLAVSSPVFAGDVARASKAMVEPQSQNALDLFSLEWDYTGRSHFHDHDLGSQDVSHSDFSYSHRFPIKGQVYFRTGVDYERFDFGGSTRAGIPSHLQSASAVFALEYVQENFAGAAIELHPGFYFEDDLRGNTFDIPIDIYTTFKINSKLYITVGVAGALNYDPQIFPIGGIIWLISDKVRLEAVFPKPALIWTPQENWEFRALGEVLGGAYRLDRGNPDRQLSNAVVQYSEYRAGAQATYSGFKPFDLFAGAGYTFLRQFDFHRSVHDRNVDGAFYVKVGVEAKF